MRPRIQALDGLRFLAALGVLWIHVWTKYHNPHWQVGHFNLTDILAIGGNGVDLFFVISGFCMYYFYGAKKSFHYKDYYNFILKRWVRLSPSFYVATILYVLKAKLIGQMGVHPLPAFLHSVFYLNYIGGQYNIASHFWTLTVEWQFYFLIAFMLIYQYKMGFRKTLLFIFGTLFFVTLTSVFIFKGSLDLLTGTIFYRGVEFGCGVIVARIILKGINVNKYRWFWLVSAIVVTYVGRIMVSKPVLSLSTDYYNLFRLAGFTIMGFGFAGVVYLAVTSSGRLSIILGNPLCRTMGRISYSFYLLHGLVFPYVVGFMIRVIPSSDGVIGPIVSALISAILIFPLAMISFRYLEMPFFSIGNLTAKLKPQNRS